MIEINIERYKMVELVTKRLSLTNANHEDIDNIQMWFVTNVHSIDMNSTENVLKELNKIITYLENYEKKYDIEFIEIRQLANSLKDYVIQTEHKSSSGLVDYQTVNTFSMMIKKSGIHRIENRKLTYKQSKFLSRRLYEGSNHKLLPFVLVDNYIGKGKIINKVREGVVNFTLLREYESRDEDKTRTLVFPDEKIDLRKNRQIEEISGDYYIYRYMDFDKKREYVLLSHDELNLDEYTITATEFWVTDYKQMGDSARLISKLPILIGFKAQDRLIKFKSHQEFFKFCNEKDFCKNCIDYVFTLPLREKYLIYDHPKWFMNFTTAMLFSSRKGDNPNYPLHFLMVAREGTGKTCLQECLNYKYKETNDIVSAESCTLKYFVPSYARSPPDIGALAKSNRICIIDEFLRAIFTNSKADKGRNEALAKMNSLLEHRRRSMGSGAKEAIGQVMMTAKAFAVTNPVHGTSSMELLCEQIDKSAISRWLVYYQDEEHIDYIQNNRTKPTDYWLEPDDFLSINDYLCSFEAKYDDEIVKSIFNDFDSVLSSNIRTVYRARYNHHIQCLIDGIIKLRCLIEQDSFFMAKEEDYQTLKEYWSKIIKSWVGGHDVVIKLDKNIRLKHLPSDAREIWRYIVENRGRVKRIDVDEKMSKIMNGNRVNSLLSLMVDWGLLIEDKYDIIAYYHNNDLIEETDDIINHKCKFCDAPECKYWSRTGKPMCKYCAENPNLKDEWPQEVLI